MEGFEPRRYIITAMMWLDCIIAGGIEGREVLSKAKLGLYAKINEESAFSEKLLWTRDRQHFTSTTLLTLPMNPTKLALVTLLCR